MVAAKTEVYMNVINIVNSDVYEPISQRISLGDFLLLMWNLHWGKQSLTLWIDFYLSVWIACAVEANFFTSWFQMYFGVLVSNWFKDEEQSKSGGIKFIYTLLTENTHERQSWPWPTVQSGADLGGFGLYDKKFIPYCEYCSCIENLQVKLEKNTKSYVCKCVPKCVLYSGKFLTSFS